MNFLAHYALIRGNNPPPLLVLGNALPDLLPLAAPRARFRQATLEPAPDGPLKTGVSTHLAADTAFHKLPSFDQAQDEMKTLLRDADFVGMRLRSFFLGHVLAELALDAVLLRADPGLADAFYDAFAGADVREATRWAEGALHTPLPALPGVLVRFTHSRYLEQYASNEGVAEGLTRLCARAGQDTFRGGNFERLTTMAAQAIIQIHALAPALLAETSRAL